MAEAFCGATARAVGDRPIPTPDQPPPDDTDPLDHRLLDACALEYTVICHKCGQNLRGLKGSGKCPECGYAIRSCIEAAMPGPDVANFETDMRLTSWMKAVARRAGRDPECVRFVFDAARYSATCGNTGVLRAMETARITATPRELCMAARDYAVFTLGGDSRRTFDQWGLHHGADLLQIVGALVEMEMIDASQELVATGAAQIVLVFKDLLPPDSPAPEGGDEDPEPQDQPTASAPDDPSESEGSAPSPPGHVPWRLLSGLSFLVTVAWGIFLVNGYSDERHPRGPGIAVLLGLIAVTVVLRLKTR